MKKVTLKLDALEVESFATLSGARIASGTVAARQDDEPPVFQTVGDFATCDPCNQASNVATCDTCQGDNCNDPPAA